MGTLRMLSPQQSGQGASAGLHNDEKHISIKSRNSLGHKVKKDLKEVKMSMKRKRSDLTNQRKTYWGTDRVTVLGLVCEKNVE